MKINDWLKLAEQKLNKTGIGTARLDSLILAEDATGKSRAYLLAHPEFELAGELVSLLASRLERRVKHEPLAYIRSKTEFYGREFIINKYVLEPRPESETMIELLKELYSHRHPRPDRGSSQKLSVKTSKNKLDSRLRGNDDTLIDVGTGSGALAISTKLEIPEAKVIAIDIDPKCLKVAKQNAKKLAVNIQFIKSDLLKSLPTTNYQLPTTILANLPYVPNKFTINPAAMREPKIAIFGGEDGLDYYRQLFDQINTFKLDVNFVLTESMPPQHTKLVEIAKKSGFKQIKEDDFIQVFSL